MDSNFAFIDFHDAESYEVAVVEEGAVPKNETTTEEERLEAVLISNIYYDVDLELLTEVKSLITMSLYPRITKTITISLYDQLIMVPTDVIISSRLSQLIWKTPLEYKPLPLPFMSHCNAQIDLVRKICKDLETYPDGVPISETVMVFAATYDRPNNGQPTRTKSANIYLYQDFAAVIIKNGYVIEHAIHGYASNINGMILTHKPIRIYYNASVGDSLDTFLNYRYQPFYTAMNGLLTPLRMSRSFDFCRAIVFCARHRLFCALCTTMRDTYNIFMNISVKVAEKSKLKSAVVIVQKPLPKLYAPRQSEDCQKYIQHYSRYNKRQYHQHHSRNNNNNSTKRSSSSISTRNNRLLKLRVPQRNPFNNYFRH